MFIQSNVSKAMRAQKNENFEKTNNESKINDFKYHKHEDLKKKKLQPARMTYFTKSILNPITTHISNIKIKNPNIISEFNEVIGCGFARL